MMDEETKELRLGAIESWKQSYMLNKMELETCLMDIESNRIRGTMLESRRSLIEARMRVIEFALARLGVRL